MLSLCGCFSRRRGKRFSSASIDKAVPKVKARPEPSEQTHSATVPRELGRLSSDDFGVQTLDLPKRKTSNALETVKSKLIRHLSYDKDPPQRLQVSPDNDKDEIARRAELRRFRAQRIQEELNEDHSKSVSTHDSIRSTRYLTPFINIGRPGHGPRDAIEFSIDSGGHLPALSSSPMQSLSSFKIRPPNSSVKRWSSCPATIREQSDLLATTPYSTSNAPPSWKRYTAPGKIAESKSLPDLLQPDVKVPQSARTRGTIPGSDSHATLDVWLALQQSQSRGSPSLSVRDHRLPSRGSRRHQNTPVDNGFSEFSQETVTIPYPVRQSGTSQRRPSASRGVIQQRGSQGTTGSKSGSAHRSRQRSLVVPFDSKKNASSSSSQGRVVLPETPGGISSSYYPSVMPSIQPSPSRSNSPANVLSIQDLQSLELSPFEWHDDNSILRRFGDEDHSSYATAEDGDDSSQDSPRIYRGIFRQSNNGEVNARQPAGRRIPDPLSIRKRRQNSRSDSIAEGISFSTPKKKNCPRAERTGLPTIWRSGSGSWDIQASLPRRISSRLWYPSRTASATNPESNAPMAVCKEGSAENELELSTGGTVGRDRCQVNNRAILRKSKANEWIELGGKLTHDASTVNRLSNQSAQQYALSQDSVAYNALQKVSQRNVSAPPLSWTRHQPRKQNKKAANLVKSPPRKDMADDQHTPGQPSPRVLTENNNVRSISFPVKMGDFVEAVLTRIIPSRKSSDDLKHSSPEPEASKILSLEPLRIDEVQTSPALDEIEMFRPGR
ncbi:hypothetical protein LLEC1_06432 [Akanthomyces lecanii]|uniref:Uncharacterized protein n=1 Tax=Cordyceps confragosa TaxID=2714763 RepID=A0A179ILY0_CORDF|nr:hypothetical protein LLEC1_06432 [Akanthomyces lecanii]